MIAPDDPRHGTNAGHVAGCRNNCCRRAKLAYDKRRKLEALRGIDRQTPAWRATRRIQALQALGWSVPRMAAHSTLTDKTIYGLNRSDTVWMSTFEQVDALYRRLAMVTPTPSTPGSSRAKNHARRMGWPPPLAWVDIDDENEKPRNWAYVSPSRGDQLRELADMGATLTDVCARLKVSREALEKWCRNHNMSATYSQLVARENTRYWVNQHGEGGAA